MTLIAPPSLDSLIRQLAERDAGLVHVERMPARAARFADPARPLDPSVRDALGVDRLWSHQAEAIDLIRAGRSVAISTGTASGKSCCYQVPIAEAAITAGRPNTALLLFPTKALAHDQLRTLGGLGIRGLVPACFDGDTGPDERTWVRRHANVVLTNPEMLHYGLLPNHPRWATFLMRLRHVVIDEMHVFRGVFGSHVAHLLRRLRRLCNHYGSDPTFVFTSATIGEPARLASELCGTGVAQVIDDGSPRGERWFALWNPPVDERGMRTSSNTVTADLVAGLLEDGRRTIAFCRSRKGAEVVAAEVRRRVSGDLVDSVRAYRGGYLADERRDIEGALADGSVKAAVATTALELGIDIGGLDACVLNGFPGTVASMWQQAGRAGRRADASLAVLVAGDDQLDQWLMAHPDQVFDRPPEPAVINPANPFVLLPHLACAAHERALSPADERYWPDLLDEGVRRLVLDDRLRVRGGPEDPAAVWHGRGVPGHRVTLRGGGSGELRIVTAGGVLVGTVDSSRARSLVHEGAIYLHQGNAWLVTGLDLDGRVATVEPHDGGEYTQPLSEVDIRVLGTDTTVGVGSARLSLGDVEVVSRVTGFKRRDVLTGELLATEPLDLPPSHLVTRSLWYTVSPDLLAGAGIAESDWPGTLHAVEHAAIGILPLFTICDRSDVGGVSTPMQADTGLPSIFIHDGHPGGAGIAELGFEAAHRHLAATLDVIATCRCTDGCPSCVQSPKCGNGNEPLDKRGAVDLLRAILAV